MSNVRMIVVNQADTATLSAEPSALATLPVTNLQKESRSRVMRTSGNGNQVIKGNPAAGAVIDGFALARHNLSSAATIQLMLFDALDQSGNLVYDSGEMQVGKLIPAGTFRVGIDPWGATLNDDLDPIFAAWFDPVPYLSFEITIKDPANETGFFDLGRLFMGLSISPENNMSWGSSLTWVDNTIQSRTDGGSLRSEGSTEYRRFSFNLEWLTDSDQIRFATETRKVAKKKDILLAGYPDDSGAKGVMFTMVAKLVEMPVFTPTHVNNYSAPFVFEES